MNKIKAAVIGLGNMGRSHCKIVTQISTIELVAVCDSNLKKVNEVAAQYQVKPFHDYAELIQSEYCDAIVIATPHYSHTSIGIAALNAGLHVLVEKPISVHKADCEKLINAHEGKNTVFAAMFNQRTNPCYRKLKQLVDQGELGRLMRVNWIITDWFRTQCYYEGGGWRATWSGEGGGVLTNQCPHQLDLLQWICGMPVKVNAHCSIGKHHQIEVEDEVTAYLEYANGATGVFITSTGEAPGTNRLELVGTRGKVVVENNRMQFIRNEIVCDEFLRTSAQAFAAPEIWNIEIPVSGEGGQHTEVFRNFAAAIQGQEELLAPAGEGIHSVELANAMILSSLKRGPVELPLDGIAFAACLEDLCQRSTYVKEVKDGGIHGFQHSF